MSYQLKIRLDENGRAVQEGCAGSPELPQSTMANHHWFADEMSAVAPREMATALARPMARPGLRGARQWGARKRTASMGLREAAFAALAIGLAIGAAMMVLIHSVVPVSSATYQVHANVSPHAVASQRSINLTGTDVGYVALAANVRSIVVPSLTTLMYESGTYADRSSAQATARDDEQSGVHAVVSSGPDFTVLLGPTLDPTGDRTLEAKFAAAEVPYFVRVWKTRARTLPVPGWSMTDIEGVEQWIATDVEITNGLISQQTGYGVPQLASWQAVRTRESHAERAQVLQLGAAGRNFLQYDAELGTAISESENPRISTDTILATLCAALVSFETLSRN